MKKLTFAIIICMCLICSAARADIVRGIELKFVTIGNAGNAGDIRTFWPYSANPYGCGAVDYIYKIGKYEVTNDQWNAFVGASGAPTGNPSDAYSRDAYWTDAGMPANHVSWYEALQFCNYLTSGDKSKGAYIFSGYDANPGEYIGIDRDAALSSYGVIYVLPTEDEWYKAAYYNGGSGYTTFSNGTDTLPAFGTEVCVDQSGPWTVGSGMQEQNSTYDMLGNLIEWNETLVSFPDPACGLRGGSYFDHLEEDIRSSNRGNTVRWPNEDAEWIGFRIASLSTPDSGVLFEDHFDNGTMSTDWDSFRPLQWVQDGWLYTQSDGSAGGRDSAAVIHESDSEWTNYSVSMTIEPVLTGTWERAFVFLRVNDVTLPPNGIWFDGYVISFTGPADSDGASLSFGRTSTDGEWVQLFHGPGIPAGSGPWEVEISATGSVIKVWLDGNLVINVVDTDPVLQGGIGIGSIWESVARFDDIVVTNLPCPYNIAGDVNDDCVFDLTDLAIMAQGWLVDCWVSPTEPVCAAID